MMVYMAAIMLFLYYLQWLALGILLANGDFAEILAISNYKLQITNYKLPITLLTISLSVIVIWQHYNLRCLGAEISDKRISKVVQAPGFIRGINPKSKIENPQAPAFIRGVNLKSKI